MRFEILVTQKSAVGLHEIGDGMGYLALVENIPALVGDALQRRAHVVVHETRLVLQGGQRRGGPVDE